jgi:putative redox protein
LCVMSLRTYPDLVAVVMKEDDDRRSLRAERIGTHRVDVELIEQLRFEASFGDFAFTIDEPPERGGTDAGPPPLSYFLAGAASCLMTQYAKLAIAKSVPLTSSKAVARGHFDRRVSGAFKDIIYEIEIESPASADAIIEIAREAELMCYAHNTLKTSVNIHTNLALNGERLEYRQ